MRSLNIRPYLLLPLILFVCSRAIGQSGWTTQRHDTDRLFRSVFFISENIGWVVSWKYVQTFPWKHDHAIWKTVDGGASWHVQLDSMQVAPHDIFFANEDLGWVATIWPGKILKTTDGGNSWSVKSDGVVQYLNQLSFPDEQHGYAVGKGSVYLFTTDSGETWSQKDLQSFGNIVWLKAVEFISPDTGWIAGYFDGGASFVLRTTNAGDEWKISPLPQGYGVGSLFFIDKNSGWAGTGNGRLYRTIDGGVRWFLQSRLPTQYELLSLYFDKGGVAYTAGYGRMLARSDDFGDSWTFQALPYDFTADGIYDTFFLNRDVGWGVGNYFIIKTTSGGAVGISKEGPAIPATSYLEQNYPNPFNPSTTIRFAISRRTAVSLTIHNSLGQTMAVLINDEYEAGNYRVVFDGSGLAAGVYFYRLQTDNSKLTKKLILLK